MAKLTHQQKLDALSYRFYQNGQWTPKAGDFYTTSRADLELYQVVSVEGGIVRTRYTEGSTAISEWQEAGFLTEGFGPKRVFVPEWVICAPEPPKVSETGWQPISTAPHSKQVLVFVPRADRPENPPVGSWQIAYQTEPAPPLQQTWRYSNGQFRGQQIGWPTHWMPLPDAPAPKDKETLPGYWRPISTAPEHVWIRTKLSTEKGENVCMRIPHKGYEDEWIERGTGISTVTHHSFAAPDLWKPLDQADKNSASGAEKPIGYISAQTFAQLLHDNSGSYEIVAPPDRLSDDLYAIYAEPGAHPGEPPQSVSDEQK